jgi:acyl carrier protein
MNNKEILDILKTIVNSINASAALNENTALVGESILDSLEFMNYITKVEESFQIRIRDSEIVSQKLGILANMVIHISGKIAVK